MMTGSELSPFRYAQRSLIYRWRVNLAIVFGIVVGTAVLTGALMVGDSVQSSLRRLTLERLGRIDSLIIAEHFFSPDLIANLKLNEQTTGSIDAIQPLILLPQATIETQSGDKRRAGNVSVLGATAEFWDLSTTANFDVPPQPQGRQIVINEPLANDLGAEVGTRLIVRLPEATRIPSESPLGDKEDRISSLAELEVIAIVPATGLGRFSLRASQALPRVAWLDPKSLQDALDQPDRINAVLIATTDANAAAPDEIIDELRRQLSPSLDDAGISLKTVELTYFDEASEEQRVAFRYFSLSTDTMMFSPSAEAVITKALTGIEHQPVTTYLANAIQLSDDDEATAPISYSTVTAVSIDSPLSPLAKINGLAKLEDDEVILNSWAAADRKAELGDRVRLTFFAPETTHGETEEQSVELTLKAIVPLTEPLLPYEQDQAARYVAEPSRANDPDLTPEVPGITDQASIDDWDPPFPFDDGLVRDPEDEEYWDSYRTTPKAFVNRATGERLWGSRFGKTTSFRIQSDGVDEAKLRQRIESAISDDSLAFGFQLLRLKRDGMQASKGTTPFNALFLGFSFFIIAAALMLVALLTRLGLEQRAAETGLLVASGLERSQIRRLFSYEAMALAFVGAGVGVAFGVGYAALMLVGLRTWWLAAVVSPFIQLSLTPTSLLLGAAMGVVAAFMTLRFTISQFSRLSPQRLLGGELTEAATSFHVSKRRVLFTRVFWLMAIASSVAAAFLTGEAQAGAFFGCGSCALIALLLQTATWLSQNPRANHPARTLSFGKLISRNIGRHPSRSVLTIGLMATACFLIIAISAFRLSPTEQGTGGFNFVAESDIALFENLNDPLVRDDLFDTDADKLEGTQVFGFRVKQGDDASCRNLYKSQRPRILGVNSSFIDRFDSPDTTQFGWGATSATNDDEKKNPWRQLRREPVDGYVPVILDKNTAMYGLHLFGGAGERFEVEYENGVVKFEVVALLANSILQGALLVDEDRMLEEFPTASGYRYFLISCPADQADVATSILTDRFSDEGLLTSDTEQLLAELMAVQNTYLLTFQSLGGLGLLLGTLGLVAVQLRSVFERRRELSVMRATGLSQRQIAHVVLGEHASLLVLGLAIGVGAALCAVLPQSLTTEVHPPWKTLCGVLLTILVVGLATGWMALAPVMKQPLVKSLRDR